MRNTNLSQALARSSVKRTALNGAGLQARHTAYNAKAGARVGGHAADIEAHRLDRQHLRASMDAPYASRPLTRRELRRGF
jgi:hypothetical protein